MRKQWFGRLFLVVFVVSILGCEFAGEATFAGEAETAKKTPKKSAKPIFRGRGKEAKLLNQWYKEGTAAGNIGDWYDNRDRGHSRMNFGAFSQLQEITYTEKERKGYVDWALTLRTRPQVVIGNSSTSAPPANGGSNPRTGYMSRNGLELLHRQYRGSNLYFYPEHHDYDPGHNHSNGEGYGDLYPTNSPYFVISQGSSGSDRVFLSAFVSALAAFRPAVKKKLIATGMLMPTLQMLFRMSNKNVQSPEKYLTGIAHPPVFNGGLIDPVAFVTGAHNLRLETLPPLVQLRVTKEDPLVLGKDYTGIQPQEKIGDTPSVIARIHRRLSKTLHLTVSAEKSFDLNNLPLTYRWVILRGDPARTRIKPNADGTTATIAVDWQKRRPIQPGSKMESNRVDIGVFAFNGTHWSPPSFITIDCLDNETRTYDPQGKLVDIGYAAVDTRIGYPTPHPLRFGTAIKWYPLRDWGKAIELATKSPTTWRERLLQAHLSEEDKNILHKAGEDLQKRIVENTPKRVELETGARLI